MPYHRNNGITIALPAKHPAGDAPGAAGWVWPDGTPGWEPGYTVKTCLAALLQGDEPVSWQCPGATPSSRDLEHAQVLVAATAFDWSHCGKREYPVYLVGVARGDVHRVVLDAPGLEPQPLTVSPGHQRVLQWLSGWAPALRVYVAGASLH